LADVPQVDDRLNGDGTGLPFGINDSALGFVLVGVLTTVWAIWFNAQKDLVSLVTQVATCLPVCLSVVLQQLVLAGTGILFLMKVKI
jgi:hypothetical protein